MVLLWWGIDRHVLVFEESNVAMRAGKGLESPVGLELFGTTKRLLKNSYSGACGRYAALQGLKPDTLF